MTNLPIATTAVFVLSSIGCIAAVAFLIRGRLHNSFVIRSSAALHRLQELNAKAAPYVAQQERIKSTFSVPVESKSKYDRFDLERHLLDFALEYEAWYENEIGSRLRALELHARYMTSVERIAADLGTSEHPRLRKQRYVAMENQLFDRRQLARPVPSARVVAEVSYRSPQGRNSYLTRAVLVP